MKALRISFMFISVMLIINSAIAYVSLPVSSADSARTKTINGKKYLMHKVLPKETWTSIAKKYKITIQELKDANQGVSMLKTNQIIQVPAIESTVRDVDSKSTDRTPSDIPAKEKSNKTETAHITSNEPKYHTVKKGETLFAISKKYNADVNDIKKWNELKSSNIGVGKKLIVSYNDIKNTTSTKIAQPDEANLIKVEPGENIGKASQQTNDGASNATPAPVEKKEFLKTAPSGKTVNQIVEAGEACWVNDADLNPNKYYALHRTAPIGTIAKVTNKMNGKFVFVKIIGRLPNTGDNFNMMIKISKAAADKIGVIDEHFQAEISYAAVETP